jgi:hypothetical protein
MGFILSANRRFCSDWPVSEEKIKRKNMKKRIIALTCGMCLLTGLGGCPCSYYSTNSTKTITHRTADVQSAVKQVVVVPSKAAGL